MTTTSEGDARNTTLWTALIADVAIAVLKLIVAATSHSAGMLAEGIHSIVDTGNAVLLFVGVKLAARPADERFPFGRGKELFFWTLIVAMSVFAMGGCVNVVEGIVRLRHATPLENVAWSFVVLGGSAIFESISLVTAVRGFRAYRRAHLPKASAADVVARAKDPTVFSVLFEDLAALAGLTVVFIGLTLSTLTKNPVYDAASSIVVGLILVVVAVVLARECRNLLVGERTFRSTIEAVRALVARDASVADVLEVRTMQIGADDVLLALKLRFKSDARREDVARVGHDVRDRFPDVKTVLVDADSFA